MIKNVYRLGPGMKGNINQKEHGKSYPTRLSRIEELWVQAHSGDNAIELTTEDSDLTFH